MKLSFNWLTEYVECTLTPAALADRLTNVGLEVEAVTRVSPRVAGVVVGRILSVEPHPNADRLTVCRVSDGAREFRIVCGAKNVKAGSCAALARVGTTLPSGATIGEATLRGVASEGMLCSERELGLGEDAKGIMLLHGGETPGQDLAAALRLDDSILEINVMPNRPDCLSVIGIAREVAAMLGSRLTLPRVGVREVGEPAARHVGVRVEDGELCPRYLARVVRNAAIGISPFRIRNRLGMAGIRAVNNVVDVTNYVLVEHGHPLHAFDAERIRGGVIVVRRARGGERLVTIDGKSRTLEEGMLVIADAEAPVAVAGVMGGRESEVGEGTKKIILESAYFKPQSIRRTSSRLGLSSDSSYRFERGADYQGLHPALNRAVQLIAELNAGEVCSGVVEVKSAAPRFRAPVLRAARLNAVLGTRLSRPTIKKYLTRLQMMAKEKGKDGLAVSPPSYRVDLKRDIDLIEEVARLDGYERIPAVAPRAAAPQSAGNNAAAGRERSREILCGLGFTEAISLSFMGADEMDKLNWKADEPQRRAVKIRNPVSEEQAYLRTSMLPPLLRCLALNASRGNHDVRLFELGTVFHPSDGAAPLERERLALAAMGNRSTARWCSGPAGCDFFYLKGVLESLVGGVAGQLTAARAAMPSCHPGRCARIAWRGNEWGWLGEMHPRVAEAYGIRGRVVFAEVDAATIYGAILGTTRYHPLPKFPSAGRDIALVADEGLEAARLISSVRDADRELIEDVELFDLFKGAQIPPGKKGLALSITLRSSRGTLTDQEIEAAMDRIRGALTQAGCELRQQ